MPHRCSNSAKRQHPGFALGNTELDSTQAAIRAAWYRTGPALPPSPAPHFGGPNGPVQSSAQRGHRRGCVPDQGISIFPTSINEMRAPRPSSAAATCSNPNPVKFARGSTTIVPAVQSAISHRQRRRLACHDAAYWPVPIRLPVRRRNARVLHTTSILRGRHDHMVTRLASRSIRSTGGNFPAWCAMVALSIPKSAPKG